LLLGALILTGCSAACSTAANADPVVHWPGRAGLAEACAADCGGRPAWPIQPAEPSAASPGASAPAAPVTPGGPGPGTAPGAGGGTGDDPRDGLLAGADLPDGFVPIAIATSHNGTVSIGGGNFPGCPALEPMTSDETTSAAVTFAKGAMGPYLTDAIVRFPAGRAQAAMDSLNSATSACRNFAQQLAGVSVRFEVTATQPPAGLGDQAIGLRMTGATDVGISVTADIVAIRRGDYVLWLNDTTVGSASAGLANGLARAAANRCAERLRSC
jgi:hypothetical protein